MRVGSLVRPKANPEGTTPLVEHDWIGVLIDFKILVDNYGDPFERYAIVRWNDKFHEEEEYIDGLEVIQ